MSPRTRESLENTLMLAEIAQLYYMDGLTQDEIARRVGLSRSHVSRMLKSARESGLVEVRINHPLQRDSRLEGELKARFNLKDCVVLARQTNSMFGLDTGKKVGALAARYLQKIIRQGSTIGLGWGSAVYETVSSGYLTPKKDVKVAQLMGSIGGVTPDIDGAQIASQLGNMLGATVYYLHAPMIVTDSSVRQGLLRDQHIRRTLEVARRSDITLVSVGLVSQRSGLYRAGYLNDADLEYIAGQGAVGDICGTFFMLDGSIAPLEIHDRILAVSSDVLKAVPNKVGVSWGEHKALANIGAARAGLINILVTDEDAALAMLAHKD
ncbi:transcriptional regulator, DeoR family [Thermobaculum terrenum ATCC BAA-798]|uniref:Transcriptional regulator, DeoR family n=1 Tax=Thermobaculum terrenum (strain ATCC BAA-798 / CCMEE 7001 / YNP1) TaxID=525904 RepID=D1CGT3_THET1|nr:sugar-binding transcriptional regulator [Thermobaculum terrenum]ACZ42954.1 transcriptional regulator, DeoR family [Thermobaculum terrenum ATCC BAA-798]